MTRVQLIQLFALHDKAIEILGSHFKFALGTAVHVVKSVQVFRQLASATTNFIQSFSGQTITALILASRDFLQRGQTGFILQHSHGQQFLLGLCRCANDQPSSLLGGGHAFAQHLNIRCVGRLQSGLEQTLVLVDGVV